MNIEDQKKGANMPFNHVKVERVVSSLEKQTSRMFKITILLLLSNIIFMYLYFSCPQTVDINLAQDETISSEQTVNR
jgi:hypothetical protein